MTPLSPPRDVQRNNCMNIVKAKEIENIGAEIGIRKLAVALGRYMFETQKTEINQDDLMRITEKTIKSL